MVGKYKVITLCGSTRFKDAFMETQKQLTLEGNIVISVGLFGHSGDKEVWIEGTKEMLDDMHKRKIDMADEIFVINVGGYIGSSTRSEIDYAVATGKGVRYMEPVLQQSFLGVFDYKRNEIIEEEAMNEINMNKAEIQESEQRLSNQTAEDFAQKAFQVSCVQAEKLLSKQDQVEDLLQRLEIKLRNLPVLGDTLTYLPKMGLMINSYVKGEYTEIPIGTIFAVVGAVIYFVSPKDIIPDKIPGIGYLDDAVVVSIALAIAKTDVDEYMDWRAKRGLDDKFKA